MQAVLRRTPLDRILTETDGLEAVALALGHPVSTDRIDGVLRGELRAIAKVHGISEIESERQAEANMNIFLA